MKLNVDLKLYGIEEEEYDNTIDEIVDFLDGLGLTVEVGIAEQGDED
jgi:hypothetical protein